jgi:protein dithiol oxidoreductase (disulfide-forming)
MPDALGTIDLKFNHPALIPSQIQEFLAVKNLARFAAATLTALFVVAGPAAHAQVLRAPAAVKYFPVNPPQPPMATSGKIEVIEFFSYGCGHCAMFQPYVDTWAKGIDASKVELIYVPVTFRPDFALLARGYYAAESLGLAKSTHHRVFDVIFNGGTPAVRTFNDVVAIYEKAGVNPADLTAAAQKMSVEEKLRKSHQMLEAFRIDGTPTMIVAGKYRVTGESAGGNDKVFAVVDELIAKELAAVKPAAK